MQNSPFSDNYRDIRRRLFGKLHALLRPNVQLMLGDLLWSLSKTELSLCTTWKPTDALWLFVVWCSIKTLPFGACVFDVVSVWFTSAKHYGKAENVMKWVWMDDLCVSHTHTVTTFILLQWSSSFQEQRWNIFKGKRWTIFVCVEITKFGGNCSEFHIDWGKWWFYIPGEDRTSVHLDTSYRNRFPPHNLEMWK